MYTHTLAACCLLVYTRTYALLPPSLLNKKINRIYSTALTSFVDALLLLGDSGCVNKMHLLLTFVREQQREEDQVVAESKHQKETIIGTST